MARDFNSYNCGEACLFEVAPEFTHAQSVLTAVIGGELACIVDEEEADRLEKNGMTELAKQMREIALSEREELDSPFGNTEIDDKVAMYIELYRNRFNDRDAPDRLMACVLCRYANLCTRN